MNISEEMMKQEFKDAIDKRAKGLSLDPIEI
jgi:hypothetical protein